MYLKKENESLKSSLAVKEGEISILRRNLEKVGGNLIIEELLISMDYLNIHDRCNPSFTKYQRLTARIFKTCASNNRMKSKASRLNLKDSKQNYSSK
jgi:hypothetical protein